MTSLATLAPAPLRVETEEPALVVLLPRDMEPLVGRFLGRKRAELPALRQALDSGDYGHIGDVGHDLKGAGSAFGFPLLSQLGRKLSQAARAADADEVELLLERLEHYLLRVRPSFI